MFLDCTHDLVCAYKPNIAFYEALGWDGLNALEKTISYIRTNAPNVPIIGDGKRGDILSTNEAYAIAKIVGLKSCEFYNRQFKTNYFTLMPCNMYGPKDNFHIKNSHFVPALIKKFVDSKNNNKKNVEIWGSGSPKREVMHVDDLASAVTFVLEKKLSKSLLVLNFVQINLTAIHSRNTTSLIQFLKA